MTLRRWVVAGAVAGGAAIGLAAPAGASSDPIADAAAHLSPGSPVYVDPAETTLLSTAQEQQLASQIESGRAPIFVAVLPASALQAAGGNPGAMPTQLGRDLGRSGSVAVVTPQGFEASNDRGSGLQPGQAGSLASQVYASDKSRGPAAALSDWVRDVQSAYAPTGSASPAAGPFRTHRSSAGGGVFGLVLLVALAVGLSRLLRRRRRAVAPPYGQPYGQQPYGQPTGMAPPNGQGYVGNYNGAGPGYWYGGGYNGQQYYRPGYYSQRSPFGASLLGGLAAGAAGGFIGEELARGFDRRDEGRDDRGGYDGGGYDQGGGGGQDWSNIPTDQSGGGGDWSGGGGWDSGGGGFDSGGGGGDGGW